MLSEWKHVHRMSISQSLHPQEIECAWSRFHEVCVFIVGRCASAKLYKALIDLGI